MKDRMTLGRDADVAETAAFTVADDRATERIVDAIDYRHDRMVEGGTVGSALKRLNDGDLEFARFVLGGGIWRDSGLTKQGFNKRLKKICDFLSTR